MHALQHSIAGPSRSLAGLDALSPGHQPETGRVGCLETCPGGFLKPFVRWIADVPQLGFLEVVIDSLSLPIVSTIQFDGMAEHGGAAAWTGSNGVMLFSKMHRKAGAAFGPGLRPSEPQVS